MQCNNIIPGWDRQTRPKEGTAYGWIQWKGTEVCMDIYCTCGTHSHIDADFAYYVQCPKCKKIYMTNPNIELVELTDEERAHLYSNVIRGKNNG